MALLVTKPLIVRNFKGFLTGKAPTIMVNSWHAFLLLESDIPRWAATEAQACPETVDASALSFPAVALSRKTRQISLVGKRGITTGIPTMKSLKFMFRLPLVNLYVWFCICPHWCFCLSSQWNHAGTWLMSLQLWWLRHPQLVKRTHMLILGATQSVNKT